MVESHAGSVALHSHEVWHRSSSLERTANERHRQIRDSIPPLCDVIRKRRQIAKVPCHTHFGYRVCGILVRSGAGTGVEIGAISMFIILITVAYALLTFAVRGSEAVDLSQQPLGSTGASNDSLLWGPYRPNLYFGVRPRIPKSLLAGLMWANVENFATIQNSESTGHAPPSVPY